MDCGRVVIGCHNYRAATGSDSATTGSFSVTLRTKFDSESAYLSFIF